MREVVLTGKNNILEIAEVMRVTKGALLEEEKGQDAFKAISIVELQVSFLSLFGSVNVSQEFASSKDTPETRFPCTKKISTQCSLLKCHCKQLISTRMHTHV